LLEVREDRQRVVPVVNDLDERTEALRYEEVEVEWSMPFRGLEEPHHLLPPPGPDRVDATIVAEPVEDLGEALQVDRRLQKCGDIHRVCPTTTGKLPGRRSPCLDSASWHTVPHLPPLSLCSHSRCSRSSDATLLASSRR